MQAKSTYSLAQIALHWAIAALVIANYFISEGMGDALDARLEGGPAPDGPTATFHVYAGVAVLVLALIRLAIRLRTGAPESSGTGLMGKAATLMHWALYALMIGVPALGAVTWFGGIDATGDLHALAANGMMAMALVHAGAALFHHYVLKDGLLTRMLRTN